MESAAHLAALRTESAAFAAAIMGEGRQEAEVPACPGWTLIDLTSHVGAVHRFWLRTVRQGDGRPGPRLPAPSREEVTVAWFTEGAEELAEALAATPPETPLWNWSGVNQTAAWVCRRMAQETAVHRVDAESAGGAIPNPISAELAADGIAEILDTFLPALIAEVDRSDADLGLDLDLGGSLLVRPTDAAAWRVEIRGGADHRAEARAAEPGDSADCLASGTASDLLLLLWNRVDRTSPKLTVNGDPGVLDRWRALPIFD